MTSQTIAFIPMAKVISTQAFLESAKRSVNTMIQETHFYHDSTNAFIDLHQVQINNFKHNTLERETNYQATFDFFLNTSPLGCDNDSIHLDSFLNIPYEHRTISILPHYYGYNDIIVGEKMVVCLDKWGHSIEIIQRIMNDYGEDYHFTSDNSTKHFILIHNTQTLEMV